MSKQQFAAYYLNLITNKHSLSASFGTHEESRPQNTTKVAFACNDALEGQHRFIS